MQGVENQLGTPSAPRPAGAGKALKRRATLAASVIAVALLALVAQLARMQIAQADFYQHQAYQQQVLHRQLSARRGRIFDRDGRLLAASVQRYSIYADPKTVKRPDVAAALLSKALRISRARLLKDFGKDSSFAWVKRQVSDVEAERVRKLDLPGIYMQKESKRIYPLAPLAAHVVGFTDIDGRGLAGVELEMDALLRGQPGMESVLCDGGRRIFRSPLDAVSRKPFNGYDIQLTIDAYIQNVTEQELAAAAEAHRPEAAAAVVLDARDGSVLALASWPSYDPQDPTASPTRDQRDVAICDAFEFGSVLKPIVVGAAIENGTVQPDTTFDCHHGVWHIGSRTLHDAEAAGFGVLSVSDIVCHSSNIGAAQIGLALGSKLLYSALYGFGLGRDSGIALPGEVGGIVRPLSAWNTYSVVSISFGQELTITPLALARAFAVFANGGRLLQPRIVKSVTPSDGGEPVYTAGAPVVNARPISADTAAKVMAMLRRVVVEGTGTKASLDDYAVAGKTGTAQLLAPDRRSYSHTRFLGSFCGIAPAGNPRIVVLVTLKAPSKGGHYGGTVAAPAVARIIEQTLHYLKVPPTPKPVLAMGDSQ